jgi:pimeloyl-ACP methyl ester carboxylesterase
MDGAPERSFHAMDTKQVNESSFPLGLLTGLDVWKRTHHSRPISGGAVSVLPEDGPLAENDVFEYHLLRPAGAPDNGRVIFLLHGLNERRWEKYLPWARRMALSSGATVILFPLAYHMNRSPRSFGEMDEVFRIYRARKASQGPEGASSHANAMLSARLEDKPFRFFTSGLQSYRDVVDLARGIKAGAHPDFGPASRIDFFGYSIGAFLAEVLLMADPDRLFSDSRLFVFCGGSVMEAAKARSRAILDGNAERALTGLFRSLEGGDWSMDGHDDWVGDEEWNCFLAMLGRGKMSALREKRFAEIGDRISGIALERDQVFPVDGVLGTLGRRIEVMDFPFDYRHEVPFPDRGVEPGLVDSALDAVFGRAAGFLGLAS